MVTLTLLPIPGSSQPSQQWTFADTTHLIRIGRSPDNDVVLDDVLVSRHHLQLQWVQTADGFRQWQATNQGTNGTFLNGVLMSQGWVQNDALIQLAKGGPMLKFSVSQAPIQAPAAVSGTGTCTHQGNIPGALFCIHCGQLAVTPQRIIRHYHVLGVLGQGGMGTTYRAWTPERPRGSSLVVLKEMNADMARNLKAQELFEREARILQSLKHPGIPEYYDFFVEGGKKYLAMELIQGEDLERRIFQKGPISLDQAVEWMIQLCEVLSYIHQHQPPLIHRDIKPANLMVRYRDQGIVVLDFGAVKEIGTPPGTRIGAPDYSAPEQDRGQPMTQSDLYAVGPTLLFLLTGESPQKYYRRKGLNYRFQVSGIPSVTPQLARVIEKVTEPKASDRYQTAQELAKAFQKCLS